MIQPALWTLIAAVVALCQQPILAQWNPPWRPSYSANSSTVTVSNGYLFISLTYTQWQGYFNNTFVLPAGGPST